MKSSTLLSDWSFSAKKSNKTKINLKKPTGIESVLLDKTTDVTATPLNPVNRSKNQVHRRVKQFW